MTLTNAIVSSINGKTTAKLCAVIGGAAISWSLAGFLSGVASTIAIVVGVLHIIDWVKDRRKK